MLLEEFLRPMGISQRTLAQAIDVPYWKINEIVNEQRGLTPSLALRLAKFFGMSVDFWINIQLCWDLYHAQQADAKVLTKIPSHLSVSTSQVVLAPKPRRRKPTTSTFWPANRVRPARVSGVSQQVG
jgi:addiction module HigA family antidote